MKTSVKILLCGALLASLTPAATAQTNLLTGKTIHTLGEAKTWTAGDASYTFITEDLDKLIAEPTNTSNVFLYPENGTLNTAENQAKGAQGFYIDLGTSQAVGSVTTTWEGAAADEFVIYLTDQVPTPAILEEEPDYSAKGLGQYTNNTAVLTSNPQGRYLVFQVTKATNWGWGVKIRSIAAFAPVDDELTTFTVSPTIFVANQETPLSLTYLNQLGVAMTDEVGVTVSSNATLSGGNLTITSGETATLTATHGDKSISVTVYVATAPQSPAATSIKTPIFTNTVTSNNSTVEFTTGYNGGATNLGTLTFPNGEVAQQFGNTRCVFFSNSETTGAWNGNINPSEKGYRNLCLDVFAGADSECTIEFESVENLEGGHTYPFTLKAGEWNPISVNVAGATKLGNLSIRFAEGNATDILLANIYFTPAYVEGDETAPVLGEVTATATKTSIELTMTATDDLSDEVYYSITDGTKTYTASGASGETVTYTIAGLQPSTEYNITVTANDGKNVSEPKVLEIKTQGMPDASTPSTVAANVVAVYSNAYGLTELPSFDAWGSKANMGTTNTETGKQVLLFGNYDGQWGGIVGLDLDINNAKTLNLDIYSETTGTLMVGPVWANTNGATTPSYKVEIDANHVDQWVTVMIDIYQVGYGLYSTTVNQIALTESTLPSFAIDNLYFAGDQPLAVEEIEVQNPENLTIYTLQGVAVGKGSEALRNLPKGIYIVGGKKVVK